MAGPERSSGTAIAAVAGLLLSLILSGCADIPQEGPVTVGRPVGDAPRALLRISAARPKVGASPEEIVRGFLRATVDVTDDRHIARQFLTGLRRDSWRADTSVVIYSGGSVLRTSTTEPVPRSATTEPVPRSATTEPVPRSATTEPVPRVTGTRVTTGTPTRARPVGPGARPTRSVTGMPTMPSVAVPLEGERAVVQVQVPVQARIDANGEYAIAAAGAVDRRGFGLVVRGGAWRIDTLDDGSILTQADIGVTFRNVPVYFPDPTGGWLVPDVRWFPVDSATATALVKAVLAGPSAWLAPGVTTGAPPGTRLTAASVPIQQGVATVDLTRVALAADPVHRQMLRAQLVRTLAVLPLILLPAVNSVTITVESRAFDIPRAPEQAASAGRPSEPSAVRLLVDPVVDQSPVVIDRGRLGRLTDHQLIPIAGLSALNAAGVSCPATATDGSAYAALVGDRLVHAVVGGKPTTLVSGLGPLTAPSFDPLGWVWAAASSTGEVRAARPDSGSVVVPVTNWPAGLTVTSLRISRDGTRALVTGLHAGVGAVFVSAVERNGAQVPVRLGKPRTLLPYLRTARSGAWLDQRRVVVLGRRAGSPEQLWTIEVGGDAAATVAVPGAVTVTAGNGDIYVGTADGAVDHLTTAWVRVATARWPSPATR